MEMQHFSHKQHPLMFQEELKNDGMQIICFGCKKAIESQGSAYVCGQCDYFLHKKCAEMPEQLNHPFHPEHPVKIFCSSPYTGEITCFCNACRRVSEGFVYHCSLCEFDIDIVCASEEGMINHECHKHQLAVLHRESLLFCDGCGLKFEDFSYICTSCQFWIHKSCASMPTTVSHVDHHHPLTLVYSLVGLSNFTHYCNICHEYVNRSRWSYYCADCKYITHVKCPVEPLRRGKSVIEEDGDDLDLIINLPLKSDETSDFIRHFNVWSRRAKTPMVKEINHWDHAEHPLTLFDKQIIDEAKYEDDKVCDACTRPISIPFYGCVGCNYFLHETCVHLPTVLRHNSHLEHPFYLKRQSDRLSFFKCNDCNLISNGFFYYCEPSKLYLDPKCALLPTIVKHEAHKHPLVQDKGSTYRCNGCGENYSGIRLGCEGCKFYLDYQCAMLPHMVRHRFDEHSLLLTYRPIEDHPSEFICEICEQEIHPQLWFYHCRDCDQSFHPKCIPSLDDYMNIKFGTIHKLGSHEHSLSFVRQTKEIYTCNCNYCGGNVYGKPVLECIPCNFKLCLSCVVDTWLRLCSSN